MKKIKMKAKELRAQRVKEVAKLGYALTEIKALKREVHEFQCEVASLTKKFKTLNDHQKLMSEALENANLKLAGFKATTNFMRPK